MYDFPARTICDVLSDMRSIDKKKYYVPLGGLIEEAQIMANRMEAGLDTQKTYWEYRDEIKKLKKQEKELKDKLKEKKDE
jgi:hypothetical protein